MFLAFDVEDGDLQFEGDETLVGGDERRLEPLAAVRTGPLAHVYLDVIEVRIEHLAGLRDGDPDRLVGCLDIVNRHCGLDDNSAVHVRVFALH